MASVDLSSRILHFGNTCPGSIMQRLRYENRGQIQKLKQLQTAFSRHPNLWGCPVGTEDASKVSEFIKAIRTLEELHIYNYEQDLEVLWPAVFHHAESLRSLAIHSPPQFVPEPGAIWTAETVQRVANELPLLRYLGMDIDTDTGTAAVKKIAAGSVLDEVAKMSRLESLRVSVVLLDTKSIFAGDNRPNAFGSQMPNPNDTVCMGLARKIFDHFYEKDAGAALKKVELRLTRRAWEDRGQFRTAKFSYLAAKQDVAGPSSEKAGEEEEAPARRYNLRSAPPPPQQPENNEPDVEVTAQGPWRGYQPTWSENVDNVMKVELEAAYKRLI